MRKGLAFLNGPKLFTFAKAGTQICRDNIVEYSDNDKLVTINNFA